MIRRSPLVDHPPAALAPRNSPVPHKPSPLPRADSTPCNPKVPEAPSKGKTEFQLRGDVKALEFAFVGARRRLVGTTVPESVYLLMQKHPGSISGFYEDAVAAYDGDLTALVEAAVHFVKVRKLRATSDPIRNANGRVYAETFARIQELEKALATVRGMSRAKVISGLIALFLNKGKEC